MTVNKWVIFVEGVDDKNFVESLIREFELQSLKVQPIHGGVHHLENVAPKLKSVHGLGQGVVIILDADQDIDGRRREVNEQIVEHSLRVSEEHVFLLPDNHQPGNLETLLEELAFCTHRNIFNCLDAYGTCLEQASADYTAPGGKGRIYAYCEALGVKPKGSERNYLDQNRWNLNAPAIEPLMRFLRSLPT